MSRGPTWIRRAGAGVFTAACTGVLALSHPGVSVADPVPKATPRISYAVGRTVHLGQGATTVRMPEFAQSLYYTSVGLLVRTNKDGSSDGGAPFHFELVNAHGKTKKLGVTLGEVVPSTDPKQPYLAWAKMKGGHIRVVVRNVRTDRNVAVVAVPGKFDWGGWIAPPVALVGSRVFVGTNGGTRVVNWRTGRAWTSRTVPGSQFPDVHGNHAVVDGARSTRVVDVASGKVLLRVSQRHRSVFVQLSPDGRFATASGGRGVGVYDLRRGTSVRLRKADWGYGWSAGGNRVYRVNGSTMTICNAATGDCHGTHIPPVPPHPGVRYPGITYES
jgi:hypothetical protein